MLETGTTAGFYYCKLTCVKCARKILLEMSSPRSPDDIIPQVTCGECLVLTNKYKMAHPDKARDIEEWQKS